MTPAKLEHLKLIDAYCEHKLAAAEYIPHYSEGAEAGWRTTRAAIALLFAMCDGAHSINTVIAAKKMGESILTAFPLELVKP